MPVCWPISSINLLTASAGSVTVIQMSENPTGLDRIEDTIAGVLDNLDRNLEAAQKKISQVTKEHVKAKGAENGERSEESSNQATQ